MRLMSKRLHNEELRRLSKITGVILILLVISLLWIGTADAAVVVPKPGPKFYVLDEANVLSSATEQMIVNTSEELNRKTKAQVAVVTLKSLNDQPLEDVSLGILRQWKLGDKKLNNGLLILVVPSEHRARIEVGYGLEGALPDAKTGRIQDENMLPAFKEGNYDLGISKGYQVIVGEVAQEYNVKVSIQPNNTTVPVETKHKTPIWLDILGVIGLLALIWIDYRLFNGFFFGFLMGTLFRGGFRGGGGFGGGSGGDSGGGGSGGGGGSSRGW